MRFYGRKIINTLFRRWTQRSQLCVKLATRCEADSDRSDIRMFEVGLSSQQYGDYEQSTGNAAYQAESTRLINCAKANGLLIPKDQWVSFGERKRQPSGESIVYLHERNQKVIKLRDPFAKASIKQLHAQDAIYEHLIHNLLFPSTRYTFLGISEDIDSVRIVLEQPYFPDQFLSPDQSQIDEYLIEGLGLKQENRYFYGNDWLSITDISSEGDNVLTDGSQLFFIDPIIKLKHPAQTVLAHYLNLLRAE